MLELTPAAQERLEKINTEPQYNGKALMLSVTRGPAGRRFNARFMNGAQIPENSSKLEAPFPVFLDDGSKEDLASASLDYRIHGKAGSFHIENAGPGEDDPAFQALKSAIENRINPQVRTFGGFVALLEVKDETAFIHYGASCPGCSPNVPASIKRKLALQLQNASPAVSRVIDTSESAGGTNPYFRA